MNLQETSNEVSFLFDIIFTKMVFMNKTVLMLEDDKDEHNLTKQTLEEIGLEITIHFFSRSDELFSYLSAKAAPALILIDNNIAPENGIEILKKLKADHRYQSIPVIILSDNNLETYSKEAYRHGASSYIMKPLTIADTRRKIEMFFKYWLEVAEV
jgi:CheY-like chemotaxis protein